MRGSLSSKLSALITLLANLHPSGAFVCPQQGRRPAHASSGSHELTPSSSSIASLLPKPLLVPSSALPATSKAGGELPPSGDFSLFDPDAEGKLQGTGSLHERLRLGADYGSTSPDISPALQQLVELASPDDDDDDASGDGTTVKEAAPTDETEKVNLGASMLDSKPPVSAADFGADAMASMDNTSADATPQADGIILELDTSGDTGNPIADPAKVQISQNPIRSINTLGDVPARIQFKDTFAPPSRIIKSLQVQLHGTPDHLQLIFSDPSGDGMKKRIEYQAHLLTAVKRYRIFRTWDLARRRLDQQSGVIGGVGGAIMQAGSFPSVVQSGIVSAPSSLDSASASGAASSTDNTSTTIDVQFDSSGWLESINVDGRTIVTTAGYLDSIYEESERFVCYPEMYLTGSATVQDISFY